MLTFLKTIPTFSFRLWGGLFLFVCLAVVATFLTSQYGFGLAPCELCLMQRIPFYAGVGVSLLLVLSAGHPRVAYALMGVLAILFLASAGLGLFHMGVEYKWWPYGGGCSGGIKKGASAVEILAALKAAPVVRCDERVRFLFGMTMAFYNMIVSAGLFITTVTALWWKRRAVCVNCA